MSKKPKSDDVSKETKKVAKNLGVDLEESASGKGENDPTSPKKTGTEAVEKEGRNSKAGKSEKKDTDTDYESLYKASAKEVNEKFLPMQKKVKRLSETTGKDIDTIISEFDSSGKDKENQDKDKTRKDHSKDDNEVVSKVSSLEKDLEQLKEKVSEHDKEATLTAKKKVESFKDKYNLSQEKYDKQIYPLLKGVSKMTKSNGDAYDLEEGLELAYVISNKDNINQIVEKKVKLQEKQKNLGGFSPTGSKQDSSVEEPQFSETQQSIAKKMGANLEEDDKEKK